MTAIESDHEGLLALIGKDYYLDNLSKVQIASRYGISRFQVARLLDEARAEGIVHIEVRFPGNLDSIDSRALAEQLGVQKLVLTRTLNDDVLQRDLLAQAVATELMRNTKAGMTVGVSWSRTLDMAARHVTGLPRCEIVQLAGALPSSGNSNPLELVQRLGRVSNGTVWPLWAPLVVDSARTAAGLRQQVEISTALTKANSLDLAAIAIGAWGPGLSTVWDRVDNEVRQNALAAGAVAECSGRLISAEGRPVRSELDPRVLAVTLEQLKRTPTVLAVAQGAARAPAVRAAIAAGVVSTLVIDESLASALSGKPAA
ncbi:sugar-binding transcriptional regulator [Psychromicrobium sp. YIM B11713]|uniref:sugar-binding transcriptional regulator n=1 Tax=Psychromicrobium sp. YIM B11713 TaxID=3145233 RepID=UPI00374E6560